jgi:hypothetical protein
LHEYSPNSTPHFNNHFFSFSMKKGFFSLLLTAAAAFSAVNAQSTLPYICGNAEDQELQIPRLEANKLAAATMVTDRNVQYAPIHFHLVGASDGSGKIKESRVFDQLCALNAAYLPVGIQFYLSPHPTYGLFDYSINNDNVFNNQNNTLLMNLRRHNNAINVFVVEEPVSNNNNPGIVLAYYNIPNDWIVSRKSHVNGSVSNSTIPHEVGHFFSLNHTFYGYECNPFDQADPTWPNAPVMSPCFSGVATERQNGTNCSTAADRICDTPPDYNFGLIWPNCSNYTGGARDPLGTLVDPQENNFMGYFNGCSAYQFTPMQNSVMLADLNSNARNYLDNTFSPVATEINTPTDLLVGPGNGSTVDFFNNVLLEWQAVDGATHYLLEIDIVPAYSTSNAQTFILENKTSQLLTNLQPNRTYYWRVKPFNLHVGCASPRSRSFKTPATGVSTNEIESLSAWQLSPNPALGELVNLTVEAGDAFEASVRITDASGRTVSLQNGVSFPQGTSSHVLDTARLPNGMYFVSLENNQGRTVRKLSIVR